MIFQKIHSRRFLNAAGEGGEGGGGAATDTAKQAAEFQSQIDALKSKNTELLNEKKATREQLAKFEGIDPEAVRNIMKRFADDEEAALIAKGEIDTVLDKRTERLKGDYDKKLTAAEQRVVDAEKRAQAFEGRVLDDSIRKAATEAGLHPQAVDDALFRGRSMFRLGADGQAVQLDESGAAVPGKDGKTPYSPKEWLEDMKEKAPHWFPASASGGGARGYNGAVSGQLKRSEMTAESKADYINKHGQQAFLKLPK